MVKIIELVVSGKVTEKAAVEIIRTILDEGGSPMDIVKEKGLLKVEGDVVDQAVEEVLKENPQALEDYFAGKEKSLNFLVGQVMKKTRGRADARSVREMMLEEIDKNYR
jgi:aspartyl-tRNA(Asn)/glutamyl-tRNA(Gln) amidotransferase subunit B